MNNLLPARPLRAGDSFTQFPELASIRLILGLGNPGMRFGGTRHNVGFAVLDQLTQILNLQLREKNDMAATEWLMPSGQKVALVKPQTFMNNSGHVLLSFAKAGLKPDQLLVVHDELERPLGTASLRFGGSAKGHNGLKSIINVVGAEFWRLQVGIGRPADKSLVADYVLSKFLPIEKPLINQAINQVVNFFAP